MSESRLNSDKQFRKISLFQRVERQLNRDRLAGERLEERGEVFDLEVAETERDDGRALVGGELVGVAAAVVELDHLAQRAEPARMHVRRGHRHPAEDRRAELS